MAGPVGRRVAPRRARPPTVDDVPARAGTVDAVAAGVEMRVAASPGRHQAAKGVGPSAEGADTHRSMPIGRWAK